ncbi:4-aminobutyrate aminotransferase [Roseiarcus fermentans]|uniref:4-aminobutyrate aminotransferase n=1 Tax=Roseiarcus fermentans TaxID=1473586 RepID=A0A366FV81_9HYPH|nr:aspartate aminotransferase family protein [Roseiarcus fermentans]RBP17655.1 4-aminobutyrate aminotransferase [Roseiarcus fermentans]
MSGGASEGDVNTSPLRARWIEGLDADTRAVLDADAEVFLHQSLSSPCLDVVTGAEGAFLTTRSGRRIFDFHGNSVHQLGHGHPAVVAAIKAQLDRLPFCPRRFTCEEAVAFAQKLGDLAPEPLGKVLLAPSGSAAIGMALKLARIATGRHKTISMWDAFHGANLDAISVGGEALFRKGAGPLLPGAEHVPPPGLARRFFGDDDRAADRLADYIDYVLEVQGDVAAVIAEPVRWTTVEPPPPGFWAKVKQACVRHGALLVFDEIPSALARCGSVYVFEQMGCTPDMVALGKGLGGGVLPQAALVVRRDLDVAGHLALGHYTHEKSPLGSAAGLATLAVIESEGLCARARALGETGRRRLDAIAARRPEIAAVRHIGAFFGVEVKDHAGRPAAARADRILYEALALGLSFKVGGGKVLTLCPPLTITDAEFDRALDILDAAFAAADA